MMESIKSRVTQENGTRLTDTVKFSTVLLNWGFLILDNMASSHWNASWLFFFMSGVRFAHNSLHSDFCEITSSPAQPQNPFPFPSFSLSHSFSLSPSLQKKKNNNLDTEKQVAPVLILNLKDSLQAVTINTVSIATVTVTLLVQQV